MLGKKLKTKLKTMLVSVAGCLGYDVLETGEIQATPIPKFQLLVV